MWNSTDVLYALFILKANSHIAKAFLDERILCDYTALHYADLFADRGGCEISQDEIDGWLKLASDIKTFTEKPAYITGGLNI